MLSLNNLTVDQVDAIKAALQCSIDHWQDELERLQKFVAFNPEYGISQLKDISSEMTFEYNKLKTRLKAAREVYEKM